MTEKISNLPGRYYLLIDWETSGSNFGGDSSIDYQGISFGALIIDNVTMESVDSLYCELQFDDTKYKWSKEAEKIHGISKDHLQQNGIPREEALYKLLEMIIKWIGGQNKIVFVGYNVDFDISFTLQLAKDCGMTGLNIHHVNIDVAGLSLWLINKWRSTDVFEYMLDRNRSGVHNALDDCKMTLEVLHNYRNMFLGVI